MLIALLLTACQTQAPASVAGIGLALNTTTIAPTTTGTLAATVTVPPPPSPTPLPTADHQSPPAVEETAVPPTTAAAIAAVESTTTVAATTTAVAPPAPGGSCADRTGDDLLTIVTQTYGLSRDYEPSDLVPLADYLPQSVTLGYPSELRAIAVEPLVSMIEAMQAAGLEVWIISGYRSYASQFIAYNKWVEQYPDRAAILSARPGYSEHQLGTTVDFGTPELEDIVGPEFEFHTYFYKTGVGAWLAENAHRFGFTLSFPAEDFELTGFYYEPWHYRYVGVDMATQLKELGLSLTAYGLAQVPEPCTPN